MLEVDVKEIEADRVTRFVLARGGSTLTYAEVIDGWRHDAQFRSQYSQILARSPYAAYRWETPPLAQRSADRPFEFVLLNAPGFATRTTDQQTYARYFTPDDHDGGIVSFTNLRGDATLVVPSPRESSDAYGHLAAFLRRGPAAQCDALWRVMAEAILSCIGETPVWISTAGGGVAWLHVRIDTQPKYYGYRPYTRA